MKISLNNISNYHLELPPVNKATAKATNTEKANRNYDAIIIQSDSRQIAEKTFSSSLARAVSGEVRNTQASEEKIQTIKNQIDSGTYRIQFEEIDSRMMLSREV